jgi:zinc transport system permease protein
MERAMIEEMLSFPFFRRALFAGVLVVVMLSVLSFFVVLKRISFMGAGISHSALGGVALGAVLGINVTLSASVFCAGIALLIGLIARRGRVREDAAIGITFSGTMALGVTLIALSESYTSGLFSYLFGSILSVTTADILVIAVYCVGVVLIVAALFKPLLYASFDRDVARTTGLPVGALHYLLLVLIALAVVASIKLVGIVLVSALLVLPAATAAQVTRTYRSMLAASVISGLVSLLAGLVLSYRFDLPSGATIVLCSCILFFLCAALFRRRRRRPSNGG